MEVVLIVIGVVALFVLIWVIVNFNNLVRARNHCDESWADIDTELKRRYNLIPNLVETVKGYSKHEQETLERVIEARNRAVLNEGSPESQAADEGRLIQEMKSLFFLAEQYPDLKANQNYLHLQEQLVETEDRIQRARRFYNGNVRDLNNLVESFPTNILAGMFGFVTKEFFTIEDRSTPEVKMG